MEGGDADVGGAEEDLVLGKCDSWSIAGTCEMARLNISRRVVKQELRREVIAAWCLGAELEADQRKRLTGDETEAREGFESVRRVLHRLEEDGRVAGVLEQDGVEDGFTG